MAKDEEVEWRRMRRFPSITVRFIILAVLNYIKSSRT